MPLATVRTQEHKDILAFSQFVKLIHSNIDAGEDETLDDLDTQVDGGLESLEFLLGITAEHPVDLHTTREVVADAHTQTSIVLTDELLDMSEAVMTAVGAIGLQAELSQGQRHIVADDEQARLVDVLLVQPIAHGIAAEVHERGGLEQEHFPSLDRRLGHKAVAPVVKMNIGCLSKSIQYHKPCVVAGQFVFVTNITQANNQVFVHELL